jgi:hypothetical protein
MPKTRGLIWLSVVLAVALGLAATPARAQENPPDGVVTWEDYTLEAGDRVEGDVVVFGGNAVIEEDSVVEGSVVVWDGNATIAGTVEGDLVVSNGDIALEESAWVRGDVVCTFNCDATRASGARIGGTLTEGVPLPDWPALEPRVRLPDPLYLWDAGPGRVLNGMLRVLRALASILVMAVVAGLVGLIWPEPTERVAGAVVRAPGPSLGIGVLISLGALVAVPVLAVLALTICLAPLSLLVTLALVAVGLFGWIGIGALLGRRLLQAFKAPTITPMWSAALGTLVLTSLSSMLDLIPCLGWLAGGVVTFVLGSLGIGAVVLTRFGMEPYAGHRAPVTGPGEDEGRPPPPPPPPESI